jgi:hypothetical protein
MKNNSVYLTVRVDYEHDEHHDVNDARIEAVNRLTSFLSAASLYEQSDGLGITDVEVCDINEE